MCQEFSEREPSFLVVSRGNRTASFKLLDRDAALSTVLGRNDVEIIDKLLLLSLPKEKLWRLM